MRLINLTPHIITLAPSDDPDTWVYVPSSGKAVLESTPGPAESLGGIPVPVVGRPTFGDISGLPEQPENGVLYIVSFPVAQRVAVERAALEAEDDQMHNHYEDLTRLEKERLRVIQKRKAVLDCVVDLGTSPADNPIRWTDEHAAQGLCSKAQVGTPRAVRRLVRA